jgi:hypothetical protein
MECGGMCATRNECNGSLKLVHVYGKDGIDWGVFYYCDEAINTDVKSGFKIDVIEDMGLYIEKGVK